MPNWKKVIVSGSDAVLNTLTLNNSGSTADTLLLTATEDSSTAAPVITLKRNSASPADADYLGQIKFKGENDADQEQVYAKITGKIQDASDGSEDGLIEFANVKAGSNTITARLKSDKLQLLNGTALEVDGQVSASSFIGDGSGLTGVGTLSSSAQIASDISGSITSTSSSIATDIASLVSFSSSLETTIYDYTGSFTGDGSGLTNVNTTVSELTTKEDTFSSATTHSVSHLFETKNVNVTVFDENDDVFIPVRINTPTTSSVVLYMEPASSGRVVISKGGHIVSGSIQIDSSSTVSDTFTSATTHSVAHTFGTKDVIVSVYDNNDDVFIPARINTPTTSSVVIYMEPATTGRVVIGKAGHIVSGSTLLDNTGVISGSAQIASDISGSFTAASSSISARLTTAESELGNTLLSSSAQIASDISGSLSATAIVALGAGIVSGSSQINLANATGTAANATSASYAENAATSSRSVNKNTNSGSICFWQGSQSEYDALGSYDSSTVYFVV